MPLQSWVVGHMGYYGGQSDPVNIRYSRRMLTAAGHESEKLHVECAEDNGCSPYRRMRFMGRDMNSPSLEKQLFRIFLPLYPRSICLLSVGHGIAADIMAVAWPALCSIAAKY